MLTGADLAMVRDFVVTDSVTAKARSLLLLTEQGVYRATHLSGTATATEFQDWADDVLVVCWQGEDGGRPR